MKALDKLKEVLVREQETIASIDNKLAQMDQADLTLAVKRGYHEGRRDILKALVEVFEEEGDRHE